MAAILSTEARGFLTRHRVARLATCNRAGVPHVIPLCYVLDDDAIYFAVDDKPKRDSGRAIKRMRNIEENPTVAIVIDDYAEDWESLAYLMIRGRAMIVDDATERARALERLREKYPQYRIMPLDEPAHPVVRITPEQVHLWRARA